MIADNGRRRRRAHFGPRVADARRLTSPPPPPPARPDADANGRRRQFRRRRGRRAAPSAAPVSSQARHARRAARPPPSRRRPPSRAPPAPSADAGAARLGQGPRRRAAQGPVARRRPPLAARRPQPSARTTVAAETAPAPTDHGGWIIQIGADDAAQGQRSARPRARPEPRRARLRRGRSPRKSPRARTSSIAPASPASTSAQPADDRPVRFAEEERLRLFRRARLRSVTHVVQQDVLGLVDLRRQSGRAAMVWMKLLASATGGRE